MKNAALLLSFLTLALPLTAQQPQAPEKTATEIATADLDSRMQWFNEARFGMFIHWGIYSILGGEYEGKQVPGYAEWIQARANIAPEKYAPLAKQFNPSSYNPEKWVIAAKKAGMKYVVITTKHHDGFCLWPSAQTTFDTEDATPFKRDIIAELAAACKKHGLKFGTYYSIIDWHHPSQSPNMQATGMWARWGNPAMKDGRKQEYVNYMKAQIKELIENYDTEILWFDGDWAGWWTLQDGEDLYRYIRQLKPSIIINNRVSKRASFKYDFGTPENMTPGAALDHYWEACWTMNHTWGYSKHDRTWKSDRVLIQKLVDIVSKGGNLLLNVGPKPDGTLQAENYLGLQALGAWLDQNKASIYGAGFTEVSAPVGTRLTAVGDNKLYLHLFAPFKGQQVTLHLKANEASAHTLVGGRKIPVSAKADTLTLDLSGLKPDPKEHVTTIAIDLPAGYQATQKPLIELKAGDTLLKAADAQITGDGPLQIETTTHALGYWTDLTQTAQWQREIVVDANFQLILVYSLDKGHGQGTATVSISNGTTLKKNLTPTAGWQDFRQLSLGTVSFKALEPITITVSGKDSPKGTKALMNLRGIILRPITR